MASASCAALRSCSAGGSLGFVRSVQLRRPATLLPSSRRAPRGCSVTVLGCSAREMEPSLPVPSWPCQASVLPLYSVTAVTARGKTYQFCSCRGHVVAGVKTSSAATPMSSTNTPSSHGQGTDRQCCARCRPGRDWPLSRYRPAPASAGRIQLALIARTTERMDAFEDWSRFRIGRAGSMRRNLAVHDTWRRVKVHSKNVVFVFHLGLASSPPIVCIVCITRPMAESASARPPGADTRRPSPPPPLARVVLFVGTGCRPSVGPSSPVLFSSTGVERVTGTCSSLRDSLCP